MEAVSKSKYIKKDVDALYYKLREHIIKDVEARNKENKAKRGEIIQNSTELLKDIKSSTYISNNYERTTVIYDVHNKRVVEKLILYALKKDETKFIVTDRIIYTYSQNGDLEKIIEIEKGEDDREDDSFGRYRYSDDNEYLSVIYKILREDSYDRFVKDIDFYYQYDFEKNKRKKLYTLRLEEDIDFDTKNNLTFLKNIIVDLLGEGNSKSYFFLKKKIGEKTKGLPNQIFNGISERRSIITEREECLIHSSTEEEDFFKREQNELNVLIEKLKLA